MDHRRIRRFHRRSSRTYPLPARGMRYAGLTKVLARREVEHALRGGDLTRPYFGLYTPASNTPEVQHAATLQALCHGTSHLVSHGTAAILWGLSDDELAPPFHVTSPPGGSRVKRPGLVSAHRSRVPEADRLQINDIPLTAPARTWADIAVSGSLLQAIMLADLCRRRGRPEFGEDPQPLASGAQLAEALGRRGRPRGLVTARRALQLSSDGVDSPMETMLRFFMHEAELPEPQVNAWICDEHGNRIVQPDLNLEVPDRHPVRGMGIPLRPGSDDQRH